MAIQVQSGTVDFMVPTRLVSHAMGRRVLAIIDGEAESKIVVDHLLATLGHQSPPAVVLLIPQPRPDEIRTRAIMADKVRQHLMARGHAVAAKAQQSLADAGLSCRSRVEIGDDTETIVRCAHEEGCDLIVMAAPEAGGLHRRIIKATGIAICSRAGQVAEISDLPVLILKRQVQR